MGEPAVEEPRKRGRPPKPEGEKTAPKRKASSDSGSPDGKKGRGRPKGSKNKPKKVTKPKVQGSRRGRPSKSAPAEEAE